MDTHDMTVVDALADGTVEALCPVCGRHILLRFPPNYKRTILVAGDETAAHRVMYSSDPDIQLQVNTEVTDPYLDPFEQWLSDQGKNE